MSETPGALSTCPDDAALVKLSSGSLDDSVRSALGKHVEGCARCRSRLDALLAQTAAPASEAAHSLAGLASSSALGRGSVLDRFIVLDRVGAGGMGEVYLAWDERLQRRVALKLVRADRLGARAAREHERLLREARSLAQLSHPNVVVVHDAVRVDDRVALAMEYVEGETLRAHWREASRDPTERVLPLRQAAAGLAAAHAKGLVHRDFKPENVLVGGDGRVRVLDFGLAGPSDVVASDGAAGTSGYVAPEVLGGGDPGPLADQFAFGVALYEALHDDKPRGDRRDATGRGGEGPAAPARPVPAKLEAVAARALSAEPERRFPSMDALLESLDDALRPPRRAPYAAAALGLVAAVSVTIAITRRPAPSCDEGAALVGKAFAPEQRDAAKRAFLASGAPYADATWVTVDTALAAYASTWARQWDSTCARSLQPRTADSAPVALELACLGRRLSELTAVVQVLTLADAKTVERAPLGVESMGRLEACADADTLALPVLVPRTPDAQARSVALRRRLDDLKALLVAGRYDELVASAKQLRADAAALGHPPTTAELLNLHGEALLQLGHAVEGRDVLFEAASAALEGNDLAAAAEAGTGLVYAVGTESQFDEATHLARLSQALLVRIGRPPRLQAELSSNLGIVLRRQGRLDESIREQRAAVDLATRGTRDEALVAQLENNLGTALQDAGTHDEAQALLRRALERRERLLGSRHPALLPTLNNLGSLLTTMGRNDEAISVLDRGLALHTELFGAEGLRFATLEDNRARAAHVAGDFEGARVRYQSALDHKRKLRGEEHPDLARSLTGIGRALLARGDAATARPLVERAVALQEKAPGVQLLLAEARLALADALVATHGDRARARSLALAAKSVFDATRPPDATVAAEIEAVLGALARPM